MYSEPGHWGQALLVIPSESVTLTQVIGLGPVAQATVLTVGSAIIVVSSHKGFESEEPFLLWALSKSR